MSINSGNSGKHCKDIKATLVDYLMRELDPPAVEGVQNHIAACAGCRKELETLNATWTQLGVLPEEEPGENLRKNFYTMLESYGEGLQPRQSKQPWAARIREWLGFDRRPALGWVFSVLFLVIGFGGGYLFSPPGQAQDEPPVKEKFLLAQQENRDLRQQLAISLMEQSSPSRRLTGIARTASVAEPDRKLLDRLLYTLDNDSNVNVRLSAVDALYLFAGKPSVKQGLVKSLSTQSSPLVQIAIMDLLVEVREKKAVKALKVLMQKNKLNPTVKARAQWCLEELI